MIDIFEFEPSTVAKFATTTRQGAIESKRESHLTEYYNFDMIILVSYRVKSKRRVEFCRWVSKALELYFGLYHQKKDFITVPYEP